MTDEIRKHAEIQVETFLSILRERYGLSDEDISRLAYDLVSLHKRAEFARSMGEWTARVIITILVTAFFSGMAWAIVHFIDIHKQ